MTRYLVDCDVEQLELEIPRDHLEGLLAYFDGRHEGDRGAAEASARGAELTFEARGGRLSLQLEGGAFRSRDLDIIDDREAEFFERVVINLFAAYRGTLRCRLRWGQARAGTHGEWVEVSVVRGRSSWPTGRVGGWLARAQPALPPAESEVAEGPPTEGLEEIIAKLEEAEHHFAEYLRLKNQRGRLAKG